MKMFVMDVVVDVYKRRNNIMSEMERIKAVRLRLPEEISSMKFRNEKYDCDYEPHQ